MSVKEFELFHGIVLTKIVRSERPTSIRLIETRDDTTAYTLNTEVALFVKHSTALRKLKREKSVAYQFSFLPRVLKEMEEARKTKEVFLALVCGLQKLKAEKMEVCLLTPDKISQLLGIAGDKQQSIIVKASTRKQLRVSSVLLENEILVPQSAIDQWEVPGS